jgi:HAT1-interacting factor 1
MAENTEAPATTTPEPNAATDTLNSIKVSLADLCAKGTSYFAHKNYNEAADYFARASELQAELNGEMDPQNAEVLFLYGRSLFKVGQSKSDVLGGRAGAQKRDKGAKPKKEQQSRRYTANETGELDRIAEEGVALVAEKNGLEAKQEDGMEPKKPLFQFTGDENFEESDEEDNVIMAC